jgi:hypothetical protein
MQFRLWLESDRQKGRSLPETGYEYRRVKIYRAANDQNFKPMDYVTRSTKFAIEHAEHQHAVTDQQHVVIEATVWAKDVYEASNPGEYFYDGPVMPGKIVYRSKGDDYEV